MFFKTIAEIKEFCSVNVTFEFAEAKIYLLKADRDFLIKNIGQDFFDDLQSEYDSEAIFDNLSTDIKDAINKLRLASASYALATWVPLGQVQIDSSGIRIISNENAKTAFQWQIRDLVKSLNDLANSSMEAALKFFSDNTATYPLFASSEAYKSFNGSFIKTADEFTSYVSILNGSVLNFLKLKPSMVKSEDFDIKAVLFPTYYNALKARVADYDTTPADDDVIAFIKPAIANLTIARAINELACTLDSNGFLSFDNTAGPDVMDGKRNASNDTLIRIKTSAERDAKTYLANLRKHLEENIGDYSEYSSDPNYTTYTSTTFNNSTDNNFFFGG